MTVYRARGMSIPQLLGLMHPGYVAGRWYGSPDVFGATFAGLNTPAERLAAHPFRIFREVVVSAMGMYCLGSGTQPLIKVGIYTAATDQPGCPPDTLVAECVADVAAATNSARQFDMPAGTILRPGMYWVASVVQPSGTQCQLAAVPLPTTSQISTGLQVTIGCPDARGAINHNSASNCTGYSRTAPLPYLPGESFLPQQFGDGAPLYSNPGAPLIALRFA